MSDSEDTKLEEEVFQGLRALLDRAIKTFAQKLVALMQDISSRMRELVDQLFPDMTEDEKCRTSKMLAWVKIILSLPVAFQNRVPNQTPP